MITSASLKMNVSDEAPPSCLSSRCQPFINCVSDEHKRRQLAEKLARIEAAMQLRRQRVSAVLNASQEDPNLRRAGIRTRFGLVPFEDAAYAFVISRQKENGFENVDQDAGRDDFFAELARSISAGDFEGWRRLTVLNGGGALRSRVCRACFPPIGLEDDFLEPDQAGYRPRRALHGFLSKSWTSVKVATAWCNEHGLPPGKGWPEYLNQVIQETQTTCIVAESAADEDPTGQTQEHAHEARSDVTVAPNPGTPSSEVTERRNGRGRRSVDVWYEEEFRRRQAAKLVLDVKEEEARWLVSNRPDHIPHASHRTISKRIARWKTDALKPKPI